MCINMYMCIHISQVLRSGCGTLYVYLYIHSYIYVYMCVYICVCVYTHIAGTSGAARCRASRPTTSCVPVPVPTGCSAAS